MNESSIDRLTFEKELEVLINKYSKEGASNTPDFILGKYLAECFCAFNAAVRQRESWYGIDPRPSVVEGIGVNPNDPK